LEKEKTLKAEVKKMSEKKSVKIKEQERRPPTAGEKKQGRRYTGENQKITAKLNEQETGQRRSRGKKQRRQYKLAPNRG
jgi:hypothetical protein